jgi:hypothetical protein
MMLQGGSGDFYSIFLDKGRGEVELMRSIGSASKKPCQNSPAKTPKKYANRICKMQL